MKYVIQQFSLTDFLGIALPGGILVLTANYYIWDIEDPCFRFFGHNVAILTAYFVALSYLCGCALHQLGICLEYLLPNEKNVFTSHCQQEAIRESYKRQFHISFPDDTNAQIKAGREIFRHVQCRDRSQRILIFSAFYSMSRTLLATLPLLLLMIAISGAATLFMVLLCIAAWVICFMRWRNFDQCCIGEAYTIFAAGAVVQELSDTQEQKGVEKL